MRAVPRARRPIVVLIALFLGLGGLGTATGAALGAVGGSPAGAPAAAPFDGHHHGPDGFRPGR